MWADLAIYMGWWWIKALNVARAEWPCPIWQYFKSQAFAVINLVQKTSVSTQVVLELLGSQMFKTENNTNFNILDRYFKYPPWQGDLQAKNHARRAFQDKWLNVLEREAR